MVNKLRHNIIIHFWVCNSTRKNFTSMTLKSFLSYLFYRFIYFVFYNKRYDMSY